MLKAGLIIVGVNLLTLSLAAYNGIPIILILLLGLVLLYTFITQKTIFAVTSTHSAVTRRRRNFQVLKLRE